MASKQAAHKRQGRAKSAAQERRSERDRRNAACALRKARLEQRKTALLCALEAKLIALGVGVRTAQRAASALVNRGLQLAREWMATWGYSYMQMEWTT